MNTTNEATIPLTVKKAAECLGISRGLIYALCRTGKIRHERHGTGRGTTRIEQTAFEEYRAACRYEPGITGARPTQASRANGQGSTFGNLDVARLFAAWRKQGVV